ncbi:PREDICTED: armadillo repeat-containing protein 3 [Tarenaya hassleriana]|uniref:armadillo repeat-containing protein 3 n=1 Tax=Tarenaya hassleriana TaxID=28532 RepID=UPI00053C91B2|nr:PREDICTED: armadillo repeat-containing protein 3 [Tarenaya hassleriana]XP_010540262.1 PREDICTED: armadillo repeat-containing protein 3 [Tarenaya hassleriana]XP_010540263.1 PREDICTED: armadillo repeat-containing protein 3 [Tarenaya hassleriana]XP_010540264.1 PREDICTED: armadillo repeat-containing protein 3 [Tarenaya hassleriana]XP_010540265.1 PREDICTED: armadillo repeat-containing protein 3 [Tarenaya hassleriana]XP_010540266.1 PREDICTED: armadillo repeat-containing protein 3 [Tarenaya hassle
MRCWKQLEFGTTTEEGINRQAMMDKQSAEEWLSLAQSLIPVALAKAKSVKNFQGRWKTISSKIDQIPTCLSDLSSHPCFSKNRLCSEQLQSVAKTLNEVIELAELCLTDKYEGKLHMQSDLDSLLGKLDLNLRDCSVLIKTGVLGEATLPLSISSSSETTKKTSLKELLARLQIGHLESKHKALESLLQVVLEDEKMLMPLIGRANIAALVQLLTANSTRIREKAVDLICLLAESGHCDEWLVSEGVLPPLVRLAESGSFVTREKAAISLQKLSMAPETAREIAGHGGILPLIDLCRTGDSVSQAAAAAALKNISAVPDLRQFLAEEGTVKVSIDLLNHGILLGSREHMAECLQNLTAANETICKAVVTEGGVTSLLAYLDGPLPQEPAVAALRNLVPYVSSETWVAVNLVPRLAHVLKSGSPGAQQAASSALCRFAASPESKRHVGESGCVSLLVKLLESKSNGCREAAAQAIAGLVTEDRSRREVRKDDKSVPNLVMLLDPNPGNTAKKYATAGLLGLSGSEKSRKVMISYGAIGYLKKLSEMEVSGAKKLLEKLERGRLRSLFQR